MPSNISTNSLLSIKNVTMKFGGLTALSDITINIDQHDLVAVIGPNGAGKTTLFNTMTGIYSPTNGDIYLNDQLLNLKSPSDIAKLGIARTFQNIRLFKNLTVLENILLAMHTNVKYRLLAAIFKTKSFKKEEARMSVEATELLKLFKLDHKKDYLAKNLPYGDQRKLEMARALATKPKIILLDEPAAGMNPTETKELSELIHFIKKQFNVAIVLIEHDMQLVMDIAEKIFVLDYGHLIASGTPKEIQNNKRVIEAYLGAEVDLENL